ncbi:hypothetical protein U1Q18_052776 [Sarracenia purpurea var. burkii]
MEPPERIQRGQVEFRQKEHLRGEPRDQKSLPPHQDEEIERGEHERSPRALFRQITPPWQASASSRYPDKRQSRSPNVVLSEYQPPYSTCALPDARPPWSRNSSAPVQAPPAVSRLPFSASSPGRLGLCMLQRQHSSHEPPWGMTRRFSLPSRLENELVAEEPLARMTGTALSAAPAASC